jgi:hypothetical protein
MKSSTKQAASPTPAPASSEARLKAAYALFMQTQKDTPDYDRTWKELLDALFANAK